MVRAPLWLILLLILAIVGLGVYGYFTTPLPFGLSSVIQTPGGGLAAPSTSTRSTPAGTRTVAGQPLVLGATNVVVQSVQRNQDLTTGGRSGPVGSFTVVDIELQNSGSEPLTPQMLILTRAMLALGLPEPLCARCVETRTNDSERKSPLFASKMSFGVLSRQSHSVGWYYRASE